jgi:hypothetical protein
MKRSLLALAMWSMASCSQPADPEPPPVCTTAAPPPTCAPAYEPTFANVFERTLKPSCGIGGAACHTARGRQGGLVFEEADEAYRGLSTGKVRAGDPSCSAVIVRLAETNPNVRMPPGRSLAADEQCAVVRWIADGAKR